MKALFRISKNLNIILLALILLISVSACEQSAEQAAANRAALQSLAEEADGLLVKFDSSVVADWDARKLLLDPLNLKEVESLGAIAPDWYRVVLTSNEFNLAKSYNDIQKLSAVAAVEPNYFVYSHATPNDALFPMQAALHNDGLNSAIEDVDIDATEAWDIQTGNPVVVAVIDSGIDYNHPDLIDRIWINDLEIDGNGKDDDNNGYVDDVYGWNFTTSMNEPGDDNGHGTHVAGIIGATANNDLGVAGINWKARLMPLKMLNAQGIGSVYTAIKSLQYAYDNGAMVSNLSWGTPNYSQALYEAVSNLATKNHLVVVSAGNDGLNLDDTPVYPAAFDLDNVLTVAASNERAQLASFSNYSASGKVHIAAPGVGVLSTLTRDDVQDEFPVGYGVMSGTSSSAAMVTGVVSLMLSQDQQMDPWKIKQTLFNSADEIGAFADKVAARGLINAFGAVSALEASAWTTPARPNAGQNTGTTPVDTGNPSATGVALSPELLNITVGDRFELMINGGEAPYTWSVSDETIGYVNEQGLFVAIASGEVTVSVTDAQGFMSNDVSVVVTEMALTPDNVTTMLLGDVIDFEITGGVGPFQWAVTGDTGSVDLVYDPATSELATVTAVVPGEIQLEIIDTSASSVLTYTSKTIRVLSTDVSIAVPPATTLLVDEVLQLHADTIGDGDITWVSSDETVAVVNAGGLVTGLTKGSVTITAQDGSGKSDTIALTINQLPIVIALPTTDTLWVGNGSQVQLSVSGGNGPYAWVSSTPNIASVDSSGMVTAVNFTPSNIADASRTATIVVADSEGNSTNINLTINKTYIATPKSAIAIDELVVLDVLAAGSTWDWTVSGTGTVLLNSANGSITGATAGEVTVTITDANGNSASTPSIPVNHLAVSIAEPATRTLWVGNGNANSLDLSASNGDGNYSWSTTDTGIVSVNASSGLVTAIAEGSATVWVTDSSGNSNSIDLTVLDFAISASSNVITEYDSLAFSHNSPASVSWSVGGSNIASISSNGLMSTTGDGTVVVTATDTLGNTDSMTITVDPLTQLRIGNVTNSTLWLNGDSTVQLSATGGLAPYTWSVSASGQDVATVNSNGLVTALDVGQATIIVTDSVGNVDTKQISVSSVTLSAASNSLKELETVQLSASGFGNLTFSVSGSGSATINSSTKVLTAQSSGSITVTVTDENGASTSINLTIVNVQNINVSAQSSTTIWTGNNANSVQLTASGGNGNLSWRVVSGGSRVNVSSNGLVTAQSTGSATVEAYDAYGRTDTINITVSEVLISGASTVSLNAGDSYTFSGIGSGTLQWSASGTGGTINQDTGVLTTTTSGTLTITMRDANNNDAVNSITVSIAAVFGGGGGGH